MGGVAAFALRAPSQFGPEAGRWQILDQRAKQRDTPSHPHPVTLADHDALPLSQPSVGYSARALAEPGRTVLSLDAPVVEPAHAGGGPARAEAACRSPCGPTPRSASRW